MKTISTILLFLFTITIYGQTFYKLHDQYDSDSSYYTIENINDSIWWLGGKNGVLNSVSANKEINPVGIDFNGKDILQIISDNNYIYIVGEGPQLCVIDKNNFNYLLYQYDDILKNSCFYDIIVLPDNKLLVSGGQHGVARAQKKLPRGFIGIIDLNCPNKSLTLTRTNKLRFFFALTKSENNIVYASGFNGLYSVIFKSNDFGRSWQRHGKIRGIIHHLYKDNNDNLWFSGTTRMRYDKVGMFGFIGKENHVRNKTDNGCIWTLLPIEEKNIIYGVNNSGEIITICKESTNFTVKPTILKNSIYYIDIFTNQSIIFGGQGKTPAIKYNE